MPNVPAIPKRNHGCRIEADLRLWGQRAVVLQNEKLRVTVLAGRGADIVEFLYKPLDVDFMWANPNGPVKEEASLPPQDSLRSFNHYYSGGWQELFPHGSKSVEAYGTDFYQHGEVWGLAWDVRIDEDTPERIAVTFSCRTRQTPFVLERRMTLNTGSTVLTLEETAHNFGRRALDIMWGHHPAFGAPFLSRDCRLYANAKTLNVNLKHRTTWPVGEYKGVREDYSRAPVPRSGKGRMLYLEDLIEGWYALVNPKLKVGFGMRWNKKQFPVVWIWQEAGGGRKDAPFYGNGYATAVEPFSNLPFARERKEKLLRVPAGKTVTARFEAFALPGGKPVRSELELRNALKA